MLSQSLVEGHRAFANVQHGDGDRSLNFVGGLVNFIFIVFLSRALRLRKTKILSLQCVFNCSANKTDLQRVFINQNMQGHRADGVSNELKVLIFYLISIFSNKLDAILPRCPHLLARTCVNLLDSEKEK